MKRSPLFLLAVAVLGLLTGTAIAGRPTTPVNDVRVDVAPTTTDVPATTIERAAAPTTTTARTTTTEAASAGVAPDNSTSIADVDRAAVRVISANAANVGGAASTIAQRLVAAGYVQVATANAIRPVDRTIVYARAGFEVAAEQVAADLGLPAGRVKPLAAGVTTNDSLGDVIVAIGSDLLG